MSRANAQSRYLPGSFNKFLAGSGNSRTDPNAVMAKYELRHLLRTFGRCDILQPMWRLAFLAVFAVTLNGCSYVYDLVAATRDGELIFLVGEESPSKPSCLREIEVVSADRIAVELASGDDATRTGYYGTVWRDEVDYKVDCQNAFPVVYGRGLRGNQRPDFGPVQPKPLARNTVYEVRAMSPGSGYGSGRFLIHDDGTVKNLSRS